MKQKYKNNRDKQNRKVALLSTVAILISVFMIVSLVYAGLYTYLEDAKRDILVEKDPQYVTNEIVARDICDMTQLPKASVAVHTTHESEPEPEPVVDEDDLEHLACVIYQEAGGDRATDECRRMVADVVLNRVNDDRFPDTIYDVLTAPRQYGLYSDTGVVWPDYAANECEREAVARAYRIAEEVLTGHHSDLYGNGYIWQAEFEQGYDIVECCGTYFGK